MADCIFCKIAVGDVPVPLLYESESVVAFRDIHPMAPVHVLIIPRVHVASMNDVTAANTVLLGEMLLAAASLARTEGIADSGYKLLIRTGSHGGQEIPHVHLHLIGGAPLTEGIRPVHSQKD